ARVDVLPIREIARRLDERFNLLTAGDRAALPRQQTLRATMDWSYNMLSSDEQMLFCQLSVFAGGFTVEAAESVCAAASAKGTAVVDLLSNLVSKSLITIETQSGEARFRMLETILEYAREKLEHAGGKETVQRRHLDFFLALAKESGPVYLWGAAEPAWLNRLEAEQANLRAALRFSLEHALTEQNLRLCTALTGFWYVRSDWVEGREWFEQVLASTAAQSVPTGLRAYMLQNAGVFAYLQGDHGRAVELLEESRPLYEALQDALPLGWILHHLSQIALIEGNYSLAAQQAAQGLGFFEKAHAKGAVANMKLYIGQIAYYQGDNSRARTLLGESLPELKELRDDVAEARALHALGLVEHKEGNDDRAGALFRESLLAARRKGDRLDMIRALEGLGSVACSQDRSIRSAMLWGAAQAQRLLIQSTPEHGVRGDNDRAIAALRAKLDAAAFARAWEQGADMTLEQAVEVALQSQDA
ncbi:MAG TPA: hypothetical protein VMJ64_14185, partial [Anaerolineales bacterium]|nr:hypothetical protein [Anaerolineales bacterium]